MSDSKEKAKVEKKLAKAQAKAVKKGVAAKLAQTPLTPPPPTPSNPSAAERSAAAAEAQLAVRRRQMWISLVGVLIAASAVVASIIKCTPHRTTPTESVTPPGDS